MLAKNATNEDIAFICDSILYKGLIGIILGFEMALAVEIIGRAMGVGLLHAWIPRELTAFALLFSFGIKVLAGFLPTRSAAKISPADALRHEWVRCYNQGMAIPIRRQHLCNNHPVVAGGGVFDHSQKAKQRKN